MSRPTFYMDEERPTLNLSPEEIARLEAEKASLADSMRGRLKSDATRIRGEGTALDAPAPESLSARVRPAPSDEPAPAEEPVPPAPALDTDTLLSGDVDTFAALFRDAQTAQGEYLEARALLETAEATWRSARQALMDYARAHGVA